MDDIVEQTFPASDPPAWGAVARLAEQSGPGGIERRRRAGADSPRS